MGEQTAVEAIRARLQTLTGPARSGGTRDMAEVLGMPLPNVTRYVRGRVAPPHDFLAAVADRYNVSLDWLYARTQTGGVQDAQQREPAWARRLDARLRHLQRQVDAIMTRDQVYEYVDGIRDKLIDEVRENRAVMGEEIAARVGREVARALKEQLPQLLGEDAPDEDGQPTQVSQP